jgi:transcriptional antiterminator RfaH
MVEDNKNPGSSAMGANGVEHHWFCVRSHPKREHIAAAHLRLLAGVEVFNPRLRIKKPTRRGIVTFIESLFPNYIFARFNAEAMLYKVKYSASVSTIVHFGTRIPTVPEAFISELKENFGDNEIQDCERHVQPGDKVTIGEGPFYGLNATVLKVLTPHQRVEVLLEMLGRTAPVIISPASLVLDSSS